VRGFVAPADEVVSIGEGGAVGTPGVVAVAAAAAGVVVFADMDVAVVVVGGGVVAVPPVVTVGVGGCGIVVGKCKFVFMLPRLALLLLLCIAYLKLVKFSTSCHYSPRCPPPTTPFGLRPARA
jgi:hypothetical protein